MFLDNQESIEYRLITFSALLFPIMAYFQHWTMVTVLLFMLALSLLKIKRKQHYVDKYGKLLVIAFVTLFISAIPNAIMDTLYAGSTKLSALDAPSRYLIGALLVLGLSQLKLNLEHLFIGVFIGLAGAFLLYPFWGSYILGLPRYFNGVASFKHFSIDVLAVAYISIVFMMSALVASLYYIDKQQKKLVLIAIVSANLASIIMMQSGSKVALIAYPLILLLILFARKTCSTATKLLLLTPIITAGIIFSTPKISLNNQSSADNYMQQRLFSDLSSMDKMNSTTIRLDMWKGGWLSFVDSPILGQGYEQRLDFHNSLVKKGKLKREMHKGKSSLHNELINTMAKKGLLGIIATSLLYLLPLLLFYRAVKANNKNYYASLNGAFIVFSFVIIGFTEAPLMGTFTSTFYVLAITFAYLSLDRTETNMSPHKALT